MIARKGERFSFCFSLHPDDTQKKKKKLIRRMPMDIVLVCKSKWDNEIIATSTGSCLTYCGPSEFSIVLTHCMAFPCFGLLYRKKKKKLSSIEEWEHIWMVIEFLELDFFFFFFNIWRGIPLKVKAHPC